MARMTDAQLIALYRKWQQTEPEGEEEITFSDFMGTASAPVEHMNNAIIVPWCGMVLCIETDGFCHT